MERQAPLFEEREVVRVLPNADTTRYRIAGLTGTVRRVHERSRGGWYYSVTIPRRRRHSFSLEEDELETTGAVAPPEPEGRTTTLRVRVDPETGDGNLLDETGKEIDVHGDVERHGLPLFTWTEIVDPVADEDDDRESAVVLGKARRPDGGWRYIVLRVDDRTLGAYDAEGLDPTAWEDEGEFLDHERPHGLEDLEREEGLDFVAAWKAPRPAFGYDEGVRVLYRPHTAPVAGRTGVVYHQFLSDDLRWSYFVLFDDVTAEVQSATVGEQDLEPTGTYGEGYNMPPDWLH